jgi:hypothetical protein
LNHIATPAASTSTAYGPAVRRPESSCGSGAPNQAAITAATRMKAIGQAGRSASFSAA